MPTLDDTYGALLIGIVFAAILYGCTCFHAWSYYANYPLDRWYTKAFVVLVLVTDTCHQIMITFAVYTYLVTYYGVVEQLGNITSSMVSGVFLNGFTTLFVQCFLAFRVYKLSNSWIVYGIVMTMVLVQFSLVLAYAIKASRYQTYAQLVALKTLSMAVNATAAAADLIIALFLCALLHRSRTGFQKSDTMITRLIVFSINTGLLTSVCAIASLICISVWPRTFIYVVFYFCIGRLYCNSLLATLNARRGPRTTSHHTTSAQTMHRLTTMHQTHSKRTRASRARDCTAPDTIAIQVETEAECVRDDDDVSESVYGEDVAVKHLEVVPVAI